MKGLSAAHMLELNAQVCNNLWQLQVAFSESIATICHNCNGRSLALSRTLEP